MAGDVVQRTGNLQRGQLYGWQYTYVMNKLVFGTDWVSLIQQNQYLDMFYKKGFYNLVGSHPGKEPCIGKFMEQFNKEANV